MPTSLNQAAEHRAALNWAGAVGPLACSGMIIAIVVVHALGSWPLAVDALGSQAITAGLVRTLFAVQTPLVWLFVETTAWRRYGPMRRGRRVLAMQALALAAAIGFLRIIAT